MMMRQTIFTLLFAAISTFAFAQGEFLGKWKTIDDATGEAKSHVEIYERGGKLYGKVVKILNEDRADSLCEKCSGKKHNQPVNGLVIIENLSKKDNYYKGGTILDPENGKEYGCSIWLEDGKLKVRGKHWSGLYRTQTWYRVK